MEHSGCSDSKKVTDGKPTHHFFIYSRLKEREDAKFNAYIREGFSHHRDYQRLLNCRLSP
jgi:hypothetical protein